MIKDVATGKKKISKILNKSRLDIEGEKNNKPSAGPLFDLNLSLKKIYICINKVPVFYLPFKSLICR